MVSPAVGKVIMVPFPFSDLHLHCPIRGSHTSRQKPSGRMRHPRPEECPWSSYNNFALDKEQVERCRMQIDYVHLPESYRV